MDRREDTVTIYTDGGCSPNPGPGGWGAILIYDGTTKEFSGAEANTTNNRMELTAAVRALEALKRPCKVVVHTDSKYLQQGITSWLPAWKKMGWKRKRGALKNVDLWRRLDELASAHAVRWKWIRGHAGNLYNERCDELVGEAIARLKQRT
jgi:ribonuclease HI